MRQFKNTALATVLAALTATGAWAQDVTLSLHQLLPERATIPAKAILPWIAKIEADSGGRIKIDHYLSMQLGGQTARAV